MSDRSFVDCKTCGNLIASMRMDRAELDRRWMETREVCLLCGSVMLYARSDSYFPVKES